MSSGVLAHLAGTGGSTGGIDLRAVALGAAFVAVVALAGSEGGWRRRVAVAMVVGAAVLSPKAGLGPIAVGVVAAASVVVVLAPRPLGRAVAATVVLALVAAGASGDVPAVDRLVDGTHVVTAAWWTGLVLGVALAWRSGAAAGRRAAHEISTPATLLVTAVIGTGAVNTAGHLGDASLALGSWWGRVLAVKIALVVGVAVIAALLRRGWVPRFESAVLGGAALAGLALAAAGAPLSGAAPSGPLFLADAVVTPLAPGANTVLGDGVRIDGREASGEVTLASGRHTIEVGDLRRTVTVKADDAPVVPATLALDDPDCLDRIAGASAATAALTAAGAAIRLEVTRGSNCAVGDVSSWSWDGAIETATAALAARGQVPVLVTDPTAIDQTGPVVLAPRLLDARVLTEIAERRLPVLVAAYRDPTTQSAVDYRVATTANGRRATAAGYEGYLAAMAMISGRPVPSADPGLYSISGVAIFPSELSHPSEAGWAPGVALTRVG